MRKSLLLTLLLSACAIGPRVPVVNIEKLDSSEKVAISKVLIFNQTQLENKKFKVLSMAEAYSCKLLSNDPPATQSNAIEQLKYYANQMSGNGISNIKCSNRELTVANCWQLITCTAEVIKFDN